ncbi:hypothetical protein EA473_19135 [Natrarchaeobius chitinivorans]|uniref:Uncharacterized protein n=1 Tax=Natrarchaeobius chitinivorans TaxID=1679083 RepID=A0A3N6MBL7_NATCH|nr:hypothetical protein EA473_19135 [Natrarchaeobius chitinivorans]
MKASVSLSRADGAIRRRVWANRHRTERFDVGCGRIGIGRSDSTSDAGDSTSGAANRRRSDDRRPTAR